MQLVRLVSAQFCSVHIHCVDANRQAVCIDAHGFLFDIDVKAVNNERYRKLRYQHAMSVSSRHRPTNCPASVEVAREILIDGN